MDRPAVIAAALAAALAPGPARAQTADAPARALPPPIVLGARAQAVQRAQRVIPTVVVVADDTSFARAIAGWDGHVRYPVLFDDGTDHAAEQIGRFVRRFGSERVVRFAARDEAPADEGEGGVIRLDRPDAEPRAPGPPAWPGDPTERAGLITAAWLDALGVADRASTLDEALGIMRAHGYEPAGVVAIDPRDPAWVAGLAIAAARLCPIVYVDFPGQSVDTAVLPATADELAEAIEGEIDALRLPWRDVGDAIDALVLAGDCPARVRAQEGDRRANLAMTDRLGRHNASGEGKRWAWAGQVFGSRADAAYRAMCGLFLPVEHAWVFDGYGVGEPWSQYDGTEAARVLEQAGLDTTLYDTPNNGNDDWRLGVARAVETDLALINSMGTSSYFQTNGGYLRAGDAPVFATPAAVHMVHSFALELPGNARAVGGRFLDHGAYAFIGSVHEPYLSAFVPTPIVARRLAAGFPWGAAGRQSGGPVWKIAVVGDPLMTLGERGERTDAALPLEGVASLDEERAGAVRDRDFARAMRALVLTGRDEDAGRLAEALWAKTPTDVTPEIAGPALGAALRTGREALVVSLFERLDEPRRRDPTSVDTLWDAGRTLLARGQGDTALGVMGANLRDGQQANDAAEIARHIASLHGREAALAYLRSARDRMPSASARKTLDRAARELSRTRP